MRLSVRLFAALALVLCLSARAHAQNFNMNVSVDGIQLGKTLLGAELKADNLKNRVVLLEFWGVNCPPCLASMPKLAAWNFEMQSLGLVVIGAHAQNAPPERVQSTALSRGANFTIVERASVKDGRDFRGIPHCMLFDHTGKCLFRGSPMEVEGLLRKAVLAAPPLVLEGKKLVRLASLNSRLKREQSFGAILKEVKISATAADPTIVEESNFVAEKLTPRRHRLINEFNWGGYLEWRLGDRYQTFLDGRTQLFTPEFWRATYLGSPEEMQQFLTRTEADAAILPVARSRFHDALLALGWRSAFRDDRAEVLLPPLQNAGAQ